METAAGKGSRISDPTIIDRMGILTMISRLRHMIRRLGETDCDTGDAWRDPLSHPAIRAMSSRELADLPFAAGYDRRHSK